MPRIPIKNFTKYNTDDLTALVEYVEQYVALHHNGVVLTRNNLTCFEFTNYSGRTPRRTRRRYNSNTGQYETQEIKVYLGRTSYRNMERLSVVAPENAFESELGFLAAVGMEEPVAPSALVQAVGEALLERYQMNYNNRRTAMDCTAVRIRIEGKVAAKKSDDDRKRERRGKASSRLASAHYALRSADRAISNVLGYVTTAKKHLKGEEHIVEEIHELLILLRAASLQAQLVLDNSQAKVATLNGGGDA